MPGLGPVPWGIIAELISIWYSLPTHRTFLDSLQKLSAVSVLHTQLLEVRPLSCTYYLSRMKQSIVEIIVGVEGIHKEMLVA